MVPSVEHIRDHEIVLLASKNPAMHTPPCTYCIIDPFAHLDAETQEHLRRMKEGIDRYEAREREERERFTIAGLLDLIHDHMVAKTEDLLKVARIGRMLFFEAVSTADDQDNTEFFIHAFEDWPDEVWQLMERRQESFGIEERDRSTGERTGRSLWDEHQR